MIHWRMLQSARSVAATACLLLAAGYSVPAAAGQQADPLADEQVLRSGGLTTDAPTLLDFFRRRSQTAAESDHVNTLIAQLGVADVAVREKAVGELVGLGPLALPALRQAVNDLDARGVSARARRCCQAIEPPAGRGLLVAALRVLARSKPDGTAEVLLAYVPAADDEMVVEQVKETLAAVAVRDGRVGAALVAALEDTVSLRRAVAGEALSGTGAARPAEALHKLLKDPVAGVRMRVALALARGGDEEAVSVLIASLDEVTLPQARTAEEYLLELAAEQAPVLPLAPEAAARKKCREAWSAWWRGTEGTSLLDEFRKRTLSEADRTHAQELIQRLGDNNYETREKASAGLAAMDTKVLPLLRQSLNHPDTEVRARIEKCVHGIEEKKDRTPPLSPTTARLVALRKPAGAAEVLLAYLAAADDETAREDVQTALATVAVRDGKPEPVLLAALGEKSAVRRAAAAVALAESGAPDQLPAVRLLLRDSDARVRQEVALALAGYAGDREAVPVLIALLKDLPPQQAGRVEEYLRLTAGDKAPTVALGTTDEERAKCRDAWESWWKEHGATVDLVALGRTPGRTSLGYTLLVLPDQAQVMEIGRDNKVRWQLTGLSNPFDAQVLPGDRVLIAEAGGGRVTERNLKNEILWEKQVQTPVGCQRLPNGNTFIITVNQLLEVDRTGREVFNRPMREGGNYLAAHKLRNGGIVFINSAGIGIILDATGNEVRRFATNHVTYGGLDVLPNGHLLVAVMNGNRISELDETGKTVWEVTVPQSPSAVFRLPNGNTLVGCQYPARVLEVDHAGKVVTDYQSGLGSRLNRVARR